MKTRVQKWGNSFALRIPKSFAAEVGLDRDALVDLSLKGGKLIVEPLPKSPMNLEELLAAVTPRISMLKWTPGLLWAGRIGKLWAMSLNVVMSSGSL